MDQKALFIQAGGAFTIALKTLNQLIDMMNPNEFKEVQRFRVWWAWTAVIALNTLFMYAIIQQVIFKIPFGSTSAPDLVLLLSEMALLLLLWLLFSIRLKTAINDTGIFYRYYPFQIRTTVIEWDELSDAYMRQYNSFYEYGGWGIRVGSAKTGRAINTTASGTQGLQLELKDGNLLLLGTAKPEEMKKVIDLNISAGRIKWGR